MRTVSLFVNACLLTLAFFFTQKTFAQAGVLDPSDPIVVYDPAHPPVEPAFGQMAKWVKTNRLGFNTSSFKAYIYKGLQFRLKFPKTYVHGVADGKTYPVFLFFHGKGEGGTMYDNEYQLYHGGEVHMNAVNDGRFDGFLLYPQSKEDDGGFTTAQMVIIREVILNYIIPQAKGDINRIYVDGLSGGGNSSWAFMIANPTLVAAGLPISSPIGRGGPQGALNSLKFTPIWQFQGELDEAPLPASTQLIINDYNNAGGNITYTIYQGQGHGCWYSAWAEPDFYSFMNRSHKANPWVLFKRTEFCPGDAINVTIGVTPGFVEYQWRKDSVLIPGASGNSITVTTAGSYDCRIRRGSEWSVWSPIPAKITIKAPTVPPTITLVGVASNVLPALDGATTVPLQVPAGYATYSWVKEGSATVLGTTAKLTASTPGDYKVKVTEQFGCSSDYTAPFRVVNAAGPSGPDAAANLLVSTVSQTALRLDWVDNASPAFDETAFEIYQALQPGGPFTFKGTVPANVLTYTQSGLVPNTRYYYKVRAVNLSAAAAASNVANGKTQVDNLAPTAPGNLVVTGSTRSSISFKWNRSTDDVGILRYEIYLNGQVNFYTTDTFYTASNLTAGQTYNITIRARDAANNLSPFSNQLTWQPVAGALNYKYYTFEGTWNNLPNYTTLTPVATGTMPNVSIAQRTQEDGFSYLWEGVITIPVAGTYTFRTNSDDGSKMWLNSLGNAASPYTFSGAATVNNDGLHGGVDAYSVDMVLQPGAYGVAFAFYEQGGGQSMNIFWRNPQTNGNYVSIPDSAFRERPSYPGIAPLKPGNLVATAASYSRINLTWSDSSDNETGFEIWRSTNATTGFVVVKTVAPNVVAYGDSSSLSGNTRYYYKIRAIGQYGESAYDRTSSFVNALTLPLPAIPNAPVGLVASGVSSSRILVTWADSATNETAYQVFRSGNNNTTYLLYATVPANSTSFTDADLYVNSVFYYKVRAVNPGGNTAYSNEDSAVTRSSAPVITDLANQYVQFGTTTTVPVTATSSENGTLTITGINLPPFATYTSTGNGTGSLVLSPVEAQVGVYPNVQLVVANTTGGTDTTTFTIEVNNNARPLLAAVSNVTLKENETAQVNLSASDTDNTGSFNWTFLNLPAFATPAITGNTVTLNVAPGYADNGVYRVTAKVDDGGNGVDTLSFLITVQDVDPVQRIAVNFTDGTYLAPAPWNNTAKVPAINDLFPALMDQTSTPTIVSLRLLTSWTGVNNLGANTNNNSGVYPDAVLRSSYYTNSLRRMRFSNLNPLTKYDISFLGSRANPSAGVGVNGTYSVGVETVALNAANNTTAVVKIQNQFPNSAGDLTVSVANAAGSVYGYLNSIVLSTVYEDNNPPAKPRNLTAVVGNNKVNLGWVDAAYNESGYEVYRSLTRGGVYTLLNPGPTNVNATAYGDSTVSGNTVYFYAIRAINAFGASAYSDTVSTLTDSKPTIDSIPSVILTVNQGYTVNIAAFDPGDVLTLSASNLPAFATFTDMGHGLGTIQINADTTRGVFTHIVVTATDEHGNSTTREFSITVDRAGLTRAYVNFNQIQPAAAPWNSTSNAPAQDYMLSGIKDQFNTTTSMNVSLLENWTAASTTGAVTGNNSGVYPDAVMKTFYYYAGEEFRQVKLSGLDTTKQYDLTFFGSRVSTTGSILTRYAVGAQSVTLDAANNTTQTAKITLIKPDVNGEIVFTVTKDTTSSGAYLNALVIESYPAVSTLPAAPANLTAYGLSTSKIRINWDSVANNSGYEIWRSNSAQSGYLKIADLATGVRTMIDSVLAPGLYYYKVRGKLSGGGFTAYSKFVAAGTMEFQANINMNDGSATAPAQAGNWNNLNALIGNGFVLPNLINTSGGSTGINWTVTKNFSGFNTSGATTGNNSGVVPDNVMKTFYYCNFADTAKLNITGLNQAYSYNFIFFASRNNPGVGVITGYKIGNRMVTLNAANNTANTIAIENVKPDQNGSVQIMIYGTQSGGFGYLNAMFIQASLSYNESTLYNRGAASATASAAETTAAPETAGTARTAPAAPAEAAITGVSAFPNPFRDDVTVKFDLKENVRNFTIRVTDQAGQTIHSKAYGETPKGRWQNKLGLQGSLLPPGVYFVNVEGLPGQGSYTQKIMRAAGRK